MLREKLKERYKPKKLIDKNLKYNSRKILPITILSKNDNRVYDVLAPYTWSTNRHIPLNSKKCNVKFLRPRKKRYPKIK